MHTRVDSGAEFVGERGCLDDVEGLPTIIDDVFLLDADHICVAIPGMFEIHGDEVDETRVDQAFHHAWMQAVGIEFYEEAEVFDLFDEEGEIVVDGWFSPCDADAFDDVLFPGETIEDCFLAVRLFCVDGLCGDEFWVVAVDATERAALCEDDGCDDARVIKKTERLEPGDDHTVSQAMGVSAQGAQDGCICE